MILPKYFRNTAWQAFRIIHSALRDSSTYHCGRITPRDLRVTCDLQVEYGIVYPSGYQVIGICVPFSELEVH